MTRIRLSATLVALAAVAFFAGGFAPAGFMPVGSADDGSERKLEDTPKLSVRGEAKLQKPADQLQIRIGVVTEADEATPALNDNNRRMRDVVKAIRGAGIGDDEYETGRFRIRPRYSRRLRGQSDPNWKPQIIGYEVTNDILVKTSQLDLAGELIGVANEAGANSVDVIGFSLADPRIHRAEAIAVATKHAIEDARALADAAALELVRVITISLDAMPVPRPEMMAQRGMAMADAGSSAPPISPGSVSVRAGVTIVYEIAARE